MFRWWGLLGALMIIFGEINIFFKILPFSFPILWFGYIFVVDALVFKLRGHSLINNDKRQFLFLMLISAAIWWSYEIINVFVQNWYYVSAGEPFNIFTPFRIVAVSFAFSTVLPGFFETYELYKSVKLFSKVQLKRKHNISHKLLYFMIGLGLFSLFAPILFPIIFFPLMWFAFFLILDPINYLHGQPSIIGHLKDKKLQIPTTLMLSGITMGFFWEFWNYWSTTKWIYNIPPAAGFLKIFEMPVLGYLGYLPFALSLYSIYYFVNSLFKHKGHLLQHKF